MCAELYHDNGLSAYHIVVVSSIPNLISMFLQKASLEASLADIQNRYGMRLAGYQNQVSTNQLTITSMHIETLFTKRAANSRFGSKKHRQYCKDVKVLDFSY